MYQPSPHPSFASSHPHIDTFTADLTDLRRVPTFLQHLTQLQVLSLGFNRITAWIKLLPDSMSSLALVGNVELTRIPQNSLPTSVSDLRWQTNQTPGLAYSTCSFGSGGWNCTCSTTTLPTDRDNPTDCELLCPELTIDELTYPTAVVTSVVNTSCSLQEPPFQEITCRFDPASKQARWQGRLLQPTVTPYVHQCASGLVVNVLALSDSSPISAFTPVTKVQWVHCTSANSLTRLENVLALVGGTVEELTIRDCFLDPSTLARLLARTQVRSIKIIDLSYNSIQVIAKQTFDLPTLLSLNLSHNSLTELPRTFSESDVIILSQLDLSYNLLTTLDELSLPNHKALVSLDLSHNQLQTFRGDQILDALNASRLDDVQLKMDNNPSRCAQVQLPTGYWTIQCDCSTGLRDVPGCPSSISCGQGTPDSVVIAATQVCDGSQDCPDGVDEAMCNQVGYLTSSLPCPALVDSCTRPCYRNASFEVKRGRMQITPTLIVCSSKGPQCQPIVLNSDGPLTATGLMDTMHVTAVWGNGTTLWLLGCWHLFGLFCLLEHRLPSFIVTDLYTC